MDNKLICRKCGGPHITIKCGKEANNKVESQIKIIDDLTKTRYQSKNDKPENRWQKPEHQTQSKPNDYNQDNKYNNKQDNRNKTEDTKPKLYKGRGYKCKIVNLPNDITENELMELLYEWGHMISVNIKHTQDFAIGFVEFKFEEEIDYLIKALDKTPFDYNIITLEKM